MLEPINKRKDLLGFQKSYAFVIGINNYPKINAHLKSAVNDAKALAQVLKYRQGFDHVELLLEAEPATDEALRANQQAQLAQGLDGINVQFSADGATFRELLARIEDPAREPRINPHDCIVFYYAGHGKPGEFTEGPAGYLLPSDARPDAARLANDSLLPMEDVFETLKVLNCHHTLLILDCCFAGKFRQASKSRAANWVSNLPLYEERFVRYKRERAWQVLVSAGPHQTAADWLGERQELSEDTHSPFAKALLEALEGQAELKAAGKKRGDGVLTSQELFLYLWDKVEKLTNSGRLGEDIQYPDLFPMSNHQGGQFIFFDPNNKLNFAERVIRNPYRGLRPFETSEHDLFFGRKAVMDTLLPRLLAQPLLVITAPSGSGKSSLVKAGLFPALTNWQNETGDRPWAEAELLVLRPGAKPWTGTKQTLDGEDASQDNGYTGLKELLPQLKKDKKQVLLLDQYEELFTEGATESERAAFEQELINLQETAADSQLRIMLTLRSDYEWMLEASAFGQSFWASDQLTRFLYRLPGMRIDELRQALVNPALAELYEFETEDLVETILAEIGDAPGALPMLSFTMSQFYELTDKDTRVFTKLTYQALGGINGALSKYADGIYEALPPDEQEVMQRLIIRMLKVNSGSYGRRRVYTKPDTNFLNHRGRSFLNEFDYADTQDALVSRVLEHLEDKQLILAGRDFIGSYYVPVHDSLIQHWTTAKQWINDFGAENINLQRDLWQAVLDSSRPQVPQFTYRALPEDGLGADDQLTSNFSKLWDSNPKLLQILEQISSAASDYLLTNKERIVEEALPQIDPEGKEKFRSFWDDCHAKGKLPDLNSLILSGYSDKLLSLFLDKGNHWLNQAETDFVQQSWNKRIESIIELKAQKERVVHEMMSATWRATTFLDEEDFGFWKGVRDTYENIKVLMDLKKAQSIAPVPVFLSGPHMEEFNMDSNDFGHYNPAFLEWVKKYAIPAERNLVLRRLTMPFYVKFLKIQIRTYYNVYKYHEKNAHILPGMAEIYRKLPVDSTDRDTAQFYRQDHGLQASEPVQIPEERKFENSLFTSVASAFWLRRTLDGTINHFREILVKILQAYDSDWLVETDKIWDSPDDYRKEAAIQNQAVLATVMDALEKANQIRLQSETLSCLSLYDKFKQLMSLKTLQSLSPVPVFIAGPHGDEFKLDAYYEVGQYNPEFLSWLAKRAFPFSSHSVLKKLTGVFFNRYLKDLARTHYWACQYWQEHPYEKEQTIKAYRLKIRNFKSSGYRTNVWEQTQYSTINVSILQATAGNSIKYTALGFWLRRHMDRTDGQFRDLLLELLRTYDEEWLATQ